MAMAHENKKEDIIKATIPLFAQEGFDGPSMEHIANNASVSKRTLYKHFSNKENLLQEIILYLIRKSSNSIQMEAFSNQTPREQLHKLVSLKLEIISNPSNLKLARILLGEMLKENNSMPNLLENALEHEEVMLKWFGSLQEKRIFRNDVSPTELARKLHDLIHGLILFPLLLRGEEPCPSIVDFITDLYLPFLLQKEAP